MVEHRNHCTSQPRQTGRKRGVETPELRGSQARPPLRRRLLVQRTIPAADSSALVKGRSRGSWPRSWRRGVGTERDRSRSPWKIPVLEASEPQGPCRRHGRVPDRMSRVLGSSRPPRGRGRH